jgi:hypothetical protein
MHKFAMPCRQSGYLVPILLYFFSGKFTSTSKLDAPLSQEFVKALDQGIYRVTMSWLLVVA